MKEIVVATKNKGKVVEIESALAHLPVKILSLSDFADIPDAEETGKTFVENAIIKAKHYAKYTGKACLADDSGLEVDALGGQPGVYSARYAGIGATDQQNNAKLLQALAGVPAHKRTGRFRCALAFVDGDELITVEGTCEGSILEQEEGNGGFGYDPLFYVPDLGLTLAEISVSEKNAISHRGRALVKMAEKLVGYFK